MIMFLHKSYEQICEYISTYKNSFCNPKNDFPQTKYTKVNIYIKSWHVKGSMNVTNISVKGNYCFVHKIMINWLNSS